MLLTMAYLLVLTNNSHAFFRKSKLMFCGHLKNNAVSNMSHYSSKCTSCTNISASLPGKVLNAIYPCSYWQGSKWIGITFISSYC